MQKGTMLTWQSSNNYEHVRKIFNSYETMNCILSGDERPTPGLWIGLEKTDTYVYSQVTNAASRQVRDRCSSLIQRIIRYSKQTDAAPFCHVKSSTVSGYLSI